MDLVEAYRILEVSIGASRDDVRKAVTKHRLRWHPDHHALSDPKLQRQANDRIKLINAAYDTVERANFPPAPSPPKPPARPTSAPSPSKPPTQPPLRIQRAELEPLVRLDDGGQGVVYDVAPLPHHKLGAVVFKEYNSDVIATADFSALRAMISFRGSLLPRDVARLIARAAWPVATVEHRGREVGFLMPRIPAHFTITLKLRYSTQSANAELQHFLDDDAALVASGIRISDRDRYELLHELAATLLMFHDHGIAVGDLSQSNLLLSFGPPRQVYFLDCDSMRLGTRSVHAQVETPDWNLVSAEELGTPHSDRYKMGLVALRLLARHLTSRDTRRLPPGVPAEVRALIGRSLSANRHDRPAMGDWLEPLRRAAGTASTVVPGPTRAPSTPSTAAPGRPTPSTTKPSPRATPAPAPRATPAAAPPAAPPRPPPVSSSPVAPPRPATGGSLVARAVFISVGLVGLIVMAVAARSSSKDRPTRRDAGIAQRPFDAQPPRLERRAIILPLGVRLREQPDKKSKELAKITGGAIVTIVDAQGTWKMVRTEGGKVGWVVESRVQEPVPDAENLAVAQYGPSQPLETVRYSGWIHADAAMTIRLVQLRGKSSVDVVAKLKGMNVVTIPDGGGGLVVGYVALAPILNDAGVDAASEVPVAELDAPASESTDALTQIQSEYMLDHFADALAAAEQHYRSTGNTAALPIAVKSACKLNDAAKARAYFSKLTDDQQAQAAEVCRAAGITLQ